MENNETKSCFIKDCLLPKAKDFFLHKTTLIVSACLVCFFIGFICGNGIGKHSQKRADQALIDAANKMSASISARNRRLNSMRQRLAVNRNVSPATQTSRNANTANRRTQNTAR